MCALISPPYHSLTKAEREAKPPHKAVRERETQTARKRRAIETVYKWKKLLDFGGNERILFKIYQV